MDDTKIIQLFWSRDEKGIDATANKYGRKLHLLANSILKNENLIINKTLDLRELESSKKKLNKGLLLSSNHMVGFYEELIAILSVVKDLSVSFDGEVVIVDNNLFKKSIPSCIAFENASEFFDYMQSDRAHENEEMELIGKYYSDVLIIDEQSVLLYPNNVHKDLELPIIDLFESRFMAPGEHNLGTEILIGTEADLVYRLSILRGQLNPVNIKKDILKADEETANLQKVLECLGIQYSLKELDTKAAEFEYDDTQFIPYLKNIFILPRRNM